MERHFDEFCPPPDDWGYEENEWESWECGYREDESIAKSYGYENVLEMKPNFFDSPEEKARKKKILAELSEKEKCYFEAELAEFRENEKIVPPITFTDILEATPSIFDGPEEYERKRINALQLYPEYFSNLPPAYKIKFPAAVKVVTSGNGIVSNASPHNVIVSQGARFSKGDFFYENGNLKYYNPENENVTVIGNMWIQLKKEIVKNKARYNEKNWVIGYETESKWFFSIYCMQNVYCREGDVNELLDEKKLRKLTQDRAYLEEGAEVKNLFKKYLNRLIEEEDFVRQNLYDCTGWIKIDGTWEYLTDKGIIGKSEKCTYAEVPYRFNYDEQLVGTKGIFDDFWNMRNLCPKHRENSVFLTYYAIAASLTTLYQEAGHELNFVVAIVGPTNSQKTAVATVVSRMFDRTQNARPDIRFDSTEVAIIEKMAAYGDAILLVDDFLPYSKNKLMSAQMKKSEAIIRSYGDRVPYQRSKIYAKINGVDAYSPVKGCCLMTGETLKTGSQSSDTRLIKLQFEKGDVDLISLSYYQNNLLNYPTFFYDFLTFVGADIDWIEQTIAEIVRATRQSEHEWITTPRFVDTFALMCAAVKIFYEYAKVRGFLSDEEVGIYAEEDASLIKAVIEKNDSESEVKSPAMLLCYALYLASKGGTITTVEAISIGEVKNFDGIICEDEEFLYILPETLRKIYHQYCKETGEDVIYRTGRELSEILKKDDLLLIKEEGGKRRATHKITSTTSKRFFIIKKGRFEEMINNFVKF